MTREKAIAIFEKTAKDGGYTTARGQGPIQIDMYVALGMLKLDEPKSANQRFAEAISNVPMNFRLSGNIIDAIEGAGLRITEK